jgi:hypothetical protein
MSSWCGGYLLVESGDGRTVNGSLTEFREGRSFPAHGFHYTMNWSLDPLATLRGYLVALHASYPVGGRAKIESIIGISQLV